MENTPPPIFAKFSDRGKPYFVRVPAATDDNKQRAREYLSKVIPHCYYANMLFLAWANEAPEYYDLYPVPGETNAQNSLARFLTDISEKRGVIEDAVR